MQFDDFWANAANITNDFIVGFHFPCRGSFSVDCSTMTLRSALTNTPTTCHSLVRCSLHGEAHTSIDGRPRELSELPSGNGVRCKLHCGQKPYACAGEEMANKSSESNLSATRMTLDRPDLGLITTRSADIPPVTNKVSQLPQICIH